jgi:hypothetical protein
VRRAARARYVAAVCFAPRVEVHTAALGWWQASGLATSQRFLPDLDCCIDFVTEFKDERLTHTFPPASFRACPPVRKSLRLTLEIVLRFLPWRLWRLTIEYQANLPRQIYPNDFYIGRLLG